MSIAVILLATVAALAVPGPAGADPANLRLALEQYHPSAPAATPWRLSAEQRAELRRQLAESAVRGQAREDGEAGRLATRDASSHGIPKKRKPPR